MPELLVDMIEAPAFVDELLGAITAYQLAVVEEVVKCDIDGILFGDDWGQQQGLLMGHGIGAASSSHGWPSSMARSSATARRCSSIAAARCRSLLPELIELGLDVFNPLQPEVMDPYDIKRQYGGRLAFYGG